MNKQTVAVAIVVKAGIVESIRLSNDFNKLRHTVLEEMAKEHGYESSGNDELDDKILQDLSTNSDYSFAVDRYTVDDVKSASRHIVVECFPVENASVCVEEGTGTTLIFNDEDSAQDYAENDCQDGKVVRI
jgi:hypothetical protein